MDRDFPFGFMVVTPSGAPDPGLAIAGSRAGALGVLNLEFAQDEAVAIGVLQQLVAHGQGRCGVLLDGESEHLLAGILGIATSALDTVVLTASALERLPAMVGSIKQSGRQAYLVVTNQTDAEAGVAAGVDALIAKGHEAGGWVGDETAFVLLQRLVAHFNLPVWIQGGIGRHTVAAAYVGGAAGCLLDSQVLLARESPLSEAVAARISAMDGSETQCWGTSVDVGFRSYARPGLPILDHVRRLETDLLIGNGAMSDRLRAWRAGIRGWVGWQEAETEMLAVGQDGAFAAGLARRFGTVGGILTGLCQAIRENLVAVHQEGPLAEGTPFAHSHGTRYPIVQGPMTRVSDQAEFAAAVAAGGGLPFLALALMRAPEVEKVLAETRTLLGDRPWGVGILGFVPPDLRAEQLEVIRRVHPPYALIAGGRPDQARTLEQAHIPTYLHVPSPGLLTLFLQEGTRRFVFEGRECGGHVGPRTSFVLWESMIDVMLENLPAGTDPGEYHVVFAGGIHDGLSTAMVAAMAAPLVKRGVRIGVLLGTAYLFTEEAVAAGAIVSGFQQAALACQRTVLVESGPGHATRCAPSPFVDAFEHEKRDLLQRGIGAEEIRDRLETLNVGRLRVAAKALDRHPSFGQDRAVSKLIAVTPEDQLARGMYMIGQVAALRDRVCTIAELHDDVAEGSTRLLAQATVPPVAEETALPQAAIAIVGMACILPGAPDLPTYWSNILNKVDAVTEVPASRWDWRRYYDPDRKATDKIDSRWGGFIPDVPFDPILFGMPPNSLASIEPFQLLTLAVVRSALQHAGYLDRPFSRERTSVVLGAGGGAGDLTVGYMTRSNLPNLFGDSAAELNARLGNALPQWTEDSFPGLLMNVAAGRVANRFDLGGVNYTVDAACASSLAAVYLAVRDLESGTSDMAIVGGLDAVQNPFSFTAFSKTHALSPSGRCRTFDADADGIAISEGFAVLVLKRLADAERDGDQVYAVIRGGGGSSDGRDRSLTAPRPEGQIRALERAYAQAGYSPATVELIEAHGTGTVVGDQAEVESLTTFFRRAGAERQRCAIGSVKSMIGHTKTTAGVAGLIKVALSLHHQVLPPTLGVTKPNPKADFPTTPFYINSEARPWVQRADGLPRRAGVSAFGFGGTNFHIAVEEYTGSYLPRQDAVVDPWLAELLIWRAGSREEILQAITELSGELERGAQPRLPDLAYTLMLRAGSVASGGPSLAIVATSLSDLQVKLQQTRSLLRAGDRHHTPQGIHYAELPLAQEGQIAFLFPGQGSQYINMLREITLAFPAARAVFDRADRVLTGRLEQPLSRYVFPPPAFTTADEQSQQAALTETSTAQPALGAADMVILGLLRSLGVEPQMVAGHSYGEFVALFSAGCFDEETLLLLSEARGRFIREGAAAESGAMAAVDADPVSLGELLSGLDITLANMNAPQQTAISGTQAVIAEAIARCTASEVRARLLPVACAFHSPLMAPAQQRLAALLGQVEMARPSIPVYSNTTGALYPDNPAEIAELLSGHLVRPVEFVREINAMYGAGARIFVEVGPRSVVTGLVSRILGEQTHLAISLDQPARPGIGAVLQGLAALVAEGVPAKIDQLFAGRAVRRLDLAALQNETGVAHYSPTTWLVGGGGARPLHQLGAAGTSPRLPLRVTVDDGDVSMAPATVAKQNTPLESVPIVVAVKSVTAATVAERNRPTMQTGAASVVDNGLPHVGHGGAVPSSNAHQITPAPPPAAATTVAPQAGHGVVANGAAGEVMMQFQKVMQRFLETQNNVMLAYLQARTAPVVAHSPRVISQSVLAAPDPVPTPVAAVDSELVVSSAPGMLIAAAPHPATHGTNGNNGAKGANGVAHEHAATAPPRAPAQTLNSAPIKGAAHGHEAVAAPTPAEPTAAPSGPTSLTREQVMEQLLGVVSERTGYPVEMLGLEADLEADLGIDSIKRVEIVGTLVRALVPGVGRVPDMETLTRSRTLRQLVDRLIAALAPAPAAPVEVGRGGPFDLEPAGDAVGRFIVRPIPAPPIGHAVPLTREGVIVIVDDLRGVGQGLAEALSHQGYQVARVVPPAIESAEDDDGIIVADLSSRDEVASLAECLLQRYGRISALVHLAALRSGSQDLGLDSEQWRARLEVDLISLFLLAQALQPALQDAATMGGSVVLAATALGGAFGADHPTAGFFPGHGGIAGFLKTLAQEAPSLRVKAVDVSPTTAQQTVEWLMTELLAADGLVEVGYRDGQRTMLEVVSAPLSVSQEARQALDSTSVVLITGGARGITAEVAVRLAGLYRPTMLLVGRTPLPATPEGAATAGITEATALRRALIEQQRTAGLPLMPARIEGDYHRLLHEREMRQNLTRLHQSGARVEYYQCDVRDDQAFAALIDTIYHTYGRIDAVIHGAGILEDKLIRDKTPESFQRVLETKVNSSLVLATKLQPETLRYLVFFSSIAGRFGNRGQADYAATNEVISKLAISLDWQWPGRVVALEWGPWAMLGMATPEIQRQFTDRGVALVPVELGCRLLIAELENGPREDSVVVIAGGPAVVSAARYGQAVAAAQERQ